MTNQTLFAIHLYRYVHNHSNPPRLRKEQECEGIWAETYEDAIRLACEYLGREVLEPVDGFETGTWFIEKIENTHIQKIAKI